MKFRLTAYLIITMIICLTNAVAKIEHLVLYYDYDKDLSNKVEDLSEVKNDGTATNTKWIKDGKIGGALEFNGKSSVIEVPHHDKLNPGGDQLTIIAWYQPRNFPAGHPPIARKGQVGAGVGCWGFDTPGGQPRGFVYLAKDGAASVAQGQETMSKDKWNHLAMAYNGKKIQIYLNGKVIGSQATTGKINENDKAPVWISKKANENIWLDGVMDDLAIFNVGLTAAEIKTYMNEGITMAVRPGMKLAVSWARVKSLVQ